MVTFQEAENELNTMKTIWSYINDEYTTVNESIFAILGRPYHENTISDYLAYILDPKQNGIGISPLMLALELFECEAPLSDNSRIDIQREYMLSNNRRIDFLITIDDEYVIGIEHKVFSEEHGDQTCDYEKKIKAEYCDPAYKLTYIYLTPNGKKPMNPSFTPISYGRLVGALRKVNIDFVRDIRKAVMFNEIIFHLEGYFLNSKTITLSKKSRLYMENYRMIEDLQKQFDKDYNKLFEHIKMIITNYFKTELNGEWIFDFKETRGFHQIYKPNWKRKGLDIHFELSMKTTSLVNGKVRFMLDIEGKKKNGFKEMCDHRLREKTIEASSDADIHYRAGKRKDTFAHKDYEFLNMENLEDESYVKQEVVRMIEDFKFFIEPVDEEIAYFDDMNLRV